jgi:hypothetical protein
MVRRPNGHPPRMTIGASLVLIAVGAILRFAVSDAIPGVELGTVGLILLIVGIIGLVLGLVLNMQAGRRDADPRIPPDRTY